MKKLADLTMQQYIDVLCGSVKPLMKSGHYPSHELLAKARRAVIYEYAKIASPAETKNRLGKSRNLTAEMMRYRFFEACQRLILISGHDDVRELLAEYGIRAKGMTDEQLAKEVKRQLLRSLANIKRARASHEDAQELPPEQIRAQFDQQTASLMTYFKFQIDVGTIKATTYAYMVQQANREIKARMAVMKKR